MSQAPMFMSGRQSVPQSGDNKDGRVSVESLSLLARSLEKYGPRPGIERVRYRSSVDGDVRRSVHCG